MDRIKNKTVNKRTPKNIDQIGSGEILVYETNSSGDISKDIIDLVLRVGGSEHVVNEINGWTYPLETYDLSESELKNNLIKLEEWVSMSETLLFYLPEITHSKVSDEKISLLYKKFLLYKNVTIPNKYFNLY